MCRRPLPKALDIDLRGGLTDAVLLALPPARPDRRGGHRRDLAHRAPGDGQAPPRATRGSHRRGLPADRDHAPSGGHPQGAVAVRAAPHLGHHARPGRQDRLTLVIPRPRAASAWTCPLAGSAMHQAPRVSCPKAGCQLQALRARLYHPPRSAEAILSDGGGPLREGPQRMLFTSYSSSQDRRSYGWLPKLDTPCDGVWVAAPKSSDGLAR